MRERTKCSKCGFVMFGPRNRRKHFVRKTKMTAGLHCRCEPAWWRIVLKEAILPYVGTLLVVLGILTIIKAV